MRTILPRSILLPLDPGDSIIPGISWMDARYHTIAPACNTTVIIGKVIMALLFCGSYRFVLSLILLRLPQRRVLWEPHSASNLTPCPKRSIQVPTTGKPCKPTFHAERHMWVILSLISHPSDIYQHACQSHNEILRCLNRYLIRKQSPLWVYWSIVT
jgi:hypothetical protein